MISYKRDVLERQSLSDVNMGSGSPISERVCKKTFVGCLWSSGPQTTLIGMILSLTLLNGPRNTSRNHCR